MATVASISKAAFDAAALAVTDAIQTATLSFETQGTYNTTTGVYDLTRTQFMGGRGVVDTVTPVADLFPDYVVGSSDKLILLEGFTSVPAEGWILTFKDQDYTIKRVQDIVQAGTLFFVIAIKSNDAYVTAGYFVDDYVVAA